MRTPDRPELLELVIKSVAEFEALSPERQADLRERQRRSWVIGEMLIEHPEMTRSQVEAIYERIKT